MTAGGPGSAAVPDGADATLEQVVAHGGWLLVDPRPTAAEHPDTFEMPTADELAALGRGSGVRVMVRTADLADPVRDGRAAHRPDGAPQLALITERMWFSVLERTDTTVTALLDNLPFAAYTRLRPGAVLTLPLTHLIATGEGPGDRLEHYLAALVEDGLPPLPEADAAAPEDPTRWPTVREDQTAVCRRAGVRPEPAWPFARMLVAADLGPEREPLHGVRFDADPERGDCGFVAFAAYDSMEAANEAVGFEVVTVQEALQRDRRLLPYLALPEGWAFTTGSLGDDVYLADIEA